MKTTLIFILSLIGFTSMSQIPQSSNLVGEYKFSGNTDDSSDVEKVPNLSDCVEEII